MWEQFSGTTTEQQKEKLLQPSSSKVDEDFTKNFTDSPHAD